MKIAIIGAGFSGMLAAYLLDKNRIDVTIYEKSDLLGGHCKTLVSDDIHIELGTVFSFTKKIKELLIELKVDYTEHFTYRNFVDENFNNVEHMLPEDVLILMQELKELQQILGQYKPYIDVVDYGYIPQDLLLPLSDFLNKHNLKATSQVIAPHLSAYGFGSLDNIQAYYAFKVFDVDTILSFIKGDKLLFVDKGTNEIINKLSQKIKDIRYNADVINIAEKENKIQVDTTFDTDYFDKVLITTKLPQDAVKDYTLNEFFSNIVTNPFVTCAFEAKKKNLITTYFKSNLGKTNKIQFFYTFKQNSRTIIVAYAYGKLDKQLISDITFDIKQTGVQIEHLIAANQWNIFPHMGTDTLSSNLYSDMIKKQSTNRIQVIGSLVSEPAIANLYLSVKNSINQILSE